MMKNNSRQVQPILPTQKMSNNIHKQPTNTVYYNSKDINLKSVTFQSILDNKISSITTIES